MRNRCLSAKCSNGGYLGCYARPDRPPGEPLAENVAHNDSGYTAMDGASGTSLAAIGDGIGIDDAEDFRDECPGNDLIIGYQITYSSASGILQIRFLCSLPSSSSSCGELLPGFSWTISKLSWTPKSLIAL